MLPLLGLAGESGSLLSEFKKWLRQGDIYKPFTDHVAEELGDILWYVADIASKMDLDLEEVARENLAKTASRWGKGSAGQRVLFPRSATRYDAGCPEHERLPRTITAKFQPVGDSCLRVTINGSQCGDPLTDNAHETDGYRFHDVFHFTMAVLFGWSPTLRKLLSCKRKSQPDTDEVEDGARASITEEAVSAVVYGFAKDYSLFDGATSIEFRLLQTIKMMTRPFEVHDRTYREWEIVILEAFKVWRQMIANNGGVFVGDADKGTIRYEALN